MAEWAATEAGDFDLRLTLESGQFFRYEAEGEGYLLLTQGHALRVRQEGGLLLFSGADLAFVRRLFGLDGAHEAALSLLQNDAAIAPLLARYRGLRIMRQDLHETILAFICSSQSNIPKIRLNLHGLATLCGMDVGGHAHLPPPGVPLDPALVRSAKTGYRAKYLVAANSMLTPAMLDALRRSDYPQSHAMLCTLPGVGPKVADCICLFGLGHGHAFPVDVHILRAMQARFPRSRLLTPQRARELAQRRWGPAAGLAQQYLYQWARDDLRRRP